MGQCPDDNVFYLDATPAGEGQTVTMNCVYGGEYYTVSVIAGEEYTFSTCGGSWDTVLTLYDTSSNLLDWNDDACGYQSEIVWTATFTGTVHVLIDEYGCTDYFSCGANLSVTWNGVVSALANDDCQNAISVSCGETISGTTVGASVSSISNCGTSISAPGVWYTIVGTGDIFTFDLCDSDYDTKINVYSGDCNNLTCITGNDDACGLQSMATFTTVAGTQYFIYVQGYGSSTGNFELDVICDSYSSSLHQDCGGAVTICNDDTFDGNTDNYGNYQDLSATNADCLTVEHQSQWFVFSPVTGGTIEFTLTPSNGIDYDFAIWGPYDETEVICPPDELPLRCSYSALYEPTGLSVGAGDTSESPSGDAWVEAITVTPSDLDKYYVMLIDNYTADNTSYEFDWDLTGVTLNCQIQFLPVEWDEFYGKVESDRNVLHWSTASELNNSHFEIERSTDNLNFEKVGEILGQGTTFSSTEYLYNDRTRPFGTSYYRLKQVDLHGEFEYSGTIALTHYAEGDLQALFPNPGKGHFKAVMNLKEATSVIIGVTDLRGANLWERVYEMGAGIQNVDIDLSDLPSGTYMISFTTAESIIARERLIKRKQ